MKLGVPCLYFTYSKVKNKRRLNETLQTKDVHGNARKTWMIFFLFNYFFHFKKR